MSKLSRQYDGQVVSEFIWGHAVGGGGSFKKIKTDDPRALREWWYTILGNYGKYPCYGIFLVLPSDEEATKFLENSGKELHIISGEYCLIIVLGSDFFNTFGLFESDSVGRKYYDDFLLEVNQNHIAEGESVKIAKLFDIELVDFPSIVFFNDIRSSDIALVSLNGLDSKEINQELRRIFDIIGKQANAPEKIVDSINKYSKHRKLQGTRQKISQTATAFVGKTIETVMEAWIKATIK